MNCKVRILFLLSPLFRFRRQTINLKGLEEMFTVNLACNTLLCKSSTKYISHIDSILSFDQGLVGGDIEYFRQWWWRAWRPRRPIKIIKWKLYRVTGFNSRFFSQGAEGQQPPGSLPRVWMLALVILSNMKVPCVVCSNSKLLATHG